MNTRKLTVGSLIPKYLATNLTIVKKAVELGSREKEKPAADLAPKVVVQQNGQSFSVRPVKGKLLLDAALEQGQSIQFKCRKGTCGQCKVKINAGTSFLQQPNELEYKKLNDSLNDGYRLACQSEFAV